MKSKILNIIILLSFIIISIIIFFVFFTYSSYNSNPQYFPDLTKPIYIIISIGILVKICSIMKLKMIKIVTISVVYMTGFILLTNSYSSKVNDYYQKTTYKNLIHLNQYLNEMGYKDIEQKLKKYNIIVKTIVTSTNENEKKRIYCVNENYIIHCDIKNHDIIEVFSKSDLKKMIEEESEKVINEEIFISDRFVVVKFNEENQSIYNITIDNLINKVILKKIK